MINKVTSMEEAVAGIPDGSTIMIGGFGISGSPLALVHALSQRPVKDLITISEDCAFVATALLGASPAMLRNKQLKKLILSFIGPHKLLNEMYQNGEVDVELIPQGVLAERIRAGGAGLGGFYSPVGVGTVVAEGKEVRSIDGKDYILEKPLRADFALIKAYKADRMGNAVFRYGGMNFNTVMATAADHVIVEAEEIVEPGEIEPDQVQLPCVFVDCVVRAERMV